MIGPYDTGVLNRVVETFVQPIDFFLSNFFGPTQVAEQETIYFDVVKDTKRRITPVVSPLSQGKVIEGMGFTTKSFNPAYLKDKRVFNPNKLFNRTAGERIGGSLTPAQRLQASIAWHLTDQMALLNRRLEVWAVETIRTGKCVIVGEDYPSVQVDFERNAAHTFALTGTGPTGVWSSGRTSMLDQLASWAEIVFANSMVTVKTVIMDLKAWNLLKTDPDFDKLLSTIRRQNGGALIQTGPMLLGADKARFMGSAGDFDFWVYNGKYVDPMDGAEKNMLPDNTVILCDPASVEGVQAYGAIKDLKAGMQPRQYFVKSWEEEDPSARYFLMQSAPLLVPYRIDATLCATVA